jgi:hypothetical protein
MNAFLNFQVYIEVRNDIFISYLFFLEGSFTLYLSFNNRRSSQFAKKKKERKKKRRKKKKKKKIRITGPGRSGAYCIASLTFNAVTFKAFAL